MNETFVVLESREERALTIEEINEELAPYLYGHFNVLPKIVNVIGDLRRFERTSFFLLPADKFFGKQFQSENIETEIERLERRIKWAEELILKANDIMSPEQVGTWEGVGAWLEEM